MRQIVLASTEIQRLRAERDQWKEIADRLYSATHESDYTIMMRACRAYEEMQDVRKEG